MKQIFSLRQTLVVTNVLAFEIANLSTIYTNDDVIVNVYDNENGTYINNLFLINKYF